MNIGICGTVGSGKSTVARAVAEVLKYRYMSGGNMFRTYAEDHGMSLEELNHGNTDEIDTEIDYSIDRLSKERKDLVVEARFSAKFCHGFHVFLYCNPCVAAERIYSNNRRGESFQSVDECLHNNLSRMGTERERGKRKYDFDMYDMRHYDLILDTTYLSPDTVTGYVLNRFEGCLISPISLYPTKHQNYEQQHLSTYVEDGIYGYIDVYFKDYLWYIVDGHHRVMSKFVNKDYVDLIDCRVNNPRNDQLSMSDIYAWEDCGKMKYKIYPKEVKKMISTEALANVKAVLFGNQKQANVINDAVVAIVTQFLDGNGVDMSTQNTTAEGIYTTLKECAEYGLSKENEVFVQLVAGRNSYNVLKEGSPYIVSQNQPNADSPKYNFRIQIVGEEAPDDEVESGDKEMYTGMKFEKPAASLDEVINPDDTIAEQVRKLKDAILPMCPEGVKSEVENEYAQALYCAQAYFDYNSR